MAASFPAIIHNGVEITSTGAALEAMEGATPEDVKFVSDAVLDRFQNNIDEHLMPNITLIFKSTYANSNGLVTPEMMK